MQIQTTDAFKRISIACDETKELLDAKREAVKECSESIKKLSDLLKRETAKMKAKMKGSIL